MLRLVVSVGIACLLVTGTGAESASEADYNARLKALQGTIKSLQADLSKAKSNRDKLQLELQAAETTIGTLQSDIRKLAEERQRQQQKLAQLQREKQTLTRARQQQQQEIAQQINSAYRLGGHSQLKLLLNLEQPEQVARINKYHQYVLAARAEKIDAYLGTIAEIDSITPRIEQQAQQLRDNEAKLQQRQQALQLRQTERQATLSRLNSDISSKDEELKTLAQDRRRLEKLLEEVASAIADLTLPGGNEPFAKRQGKMQLPASGPIIKGFGQAKVAGKLNWEGILIKAAAGTDVKAIHHGRVVFSDYLRGHGLLLIIDHGGGYMSLYAHNQALLKETGEWVSAGEAVARVGNTGGQNQTALYFEIRHQGKPTDPLRWCRKA